MTTITPDFFRTVLPSRSSSASSLASRTIGHYLEDTKRAAGDAASSLPARAFADLARVARECTKEGWDGYHAKPIMQAACNRARAFLSDLPPWMSAPDIVPEADGEIAIEWYIAPDQTFSISIGESGPVHYAGLFGHEREVHGVEPFDGVVAEEILQFICKLLRSTAARRAA